MLKILIIQVVFFWVVLIKVMFMLHLLKTINIVILIILMMKKIYRIDWGVGFENLGNIIFHLGWTYNLSQLS